MRSRRERSRWSLRFRSRAAGKWTAPHNVGGGPRGGGRSAWEDRDEMPCLLLILALAFPRVVLLVLFLFTRYIHQAYDNLILPIVGFFLLPLTTLAYAWMANTGTAVDGMYLLILIVAAIIDLGSLGGGYRWRW